MKNWFRMEVATDAPATADIYLFDIIGGWVDDMYRAMGWDFGTTTAKTFLDELSKLPEDTKVIRLHINSPGGDVFSAAAIANILRAEQTKGRTVDVFVEGLAASAASVVMMAGSSITIADNALVMIHNPWSCLCGNATEMRKMADELDKLRDSIVASYQWHSTLDAAAIVALMEAETWMDADEAIANGFATAKVEGLKAAACLSPKAIARLHVPEQFKARLDALVAPVDTPEPPAPPTPPTAMAAAAVDVIRACAKAGCADLTEELVTAGLTMEQVTAKLTEVSGQRQAEAVRVTDITALCDRAKCPELAAGYIRGGMPLAEVKAQLAIVTAKVDNKEIDGTIDPDLSGRRASTLNPADVYAARNAPKSH